MLTRQYGDIVFECDACDEVLETTEYEFDHAIVEFRRQGWKAEKVGSDWTHLCEACQGRRPSGLFGGMR